MVSRTTPSRMLGLATPRRTTRRTAAAVTRSGSPICLRPRLRNTTPTDSRTSATSSTINILVMLQIPVTNQLHVVLFNQRTNPRADQSVEFILKFVERRMGVKLRIAGRQPRDEPANII